ncbi:hypothetical protein MA9V2_058 [Chryseobacterium phage MA9V-2]|nr:hypothetical protein MA9V2_058 [Chryseobacterium phage MA9V-2]
MRIRGGVKFYPEQNKDKEKAITHVMKDTGLYQAWENKEISAKNYKRIRHALRTFGNVCATHELSKAEAKLLTDAKVPVNLVWSDIFTDALADEFTKWASKRDDIIGKPTSPDRLLVAVMPMFLKTQNLEILATLTRSFESEGYKNFKYRPTVVYHGTPVKTKFLDAEPEYSNIDFALYRAAIAANKIYNSFYA